MLAVSDTGCGIAPADLDRIFHRFSRAGTHRRREAGGFGLGLAIVQAISEAHHGTVQVQSTHGAGSTFQVTLPLCPAAPAPGLTPAWPGRVPASAEQAMVRADG